MELLLSICLGLGLSAACGFRVFVPMLVMSIAANAGHLHLLPAFAWIGSPAAIVAFGVATAIEVGGYYIPWVDHLLDTAATPAAVRSAQRPTACRLCEARDTSRIATASQPTGRTTSRTSSSANGTRFETDVNARCTAGYKPVEYHRSTMDGDSGSTAAATPATRMHRIQTRRTAPFTVLRANLFHTTSVISAVYADYTAAT